MRDAKGILLTGATGYLGSRVAQLLQRRAMPWHPLTARLEHLTPRSLRAACVIHCAGALRNRPDQLDAANAHGTRTLLAALGDEARIVYVSSRAVYAQNAHRLADEGAVVGPFDEYGASKRAAEMAIRESGRPWVILRPPGIFGHPTRSGNFLDQALDRALMGQPVVLALPDRDEDYVCVDWLADVLIRAALSEAYDGMVLNAGGPPRSLAGTIESMGLALQAAQRPVPHLERTALPYPTTVLLDSRRIHEVMRPPTHPTDEAIFRRMIAGRLHRD